MYKVLVLPPDNRLAEVCSTECRALLAERCDPIWNTLGRDYTEGELADLIPYADIVLTSWGSPAISEAVLSHAHQLKAVAHAAGTVKKLVPRSIFERNVAVFSGAQRIALMVGEYCLAAVMAYVSRLHEFDQGIRDGGWKSPDLNRYEVTGRRIGIISASSTARAFIKLLSPFACDILVYDPFLSGEAAAKLGVRTASLEEVMQCPIISVHAPAIQATENLLTKELLRLIPDGALFINSSRAAVLDEEALIEELKTGRFSAVLDVFAKEPLLTDHPFRKMKNVLLTPHVAGNTRDGRLSLMHEVLQDALRYLNGEPTIYKVNQDLWDIIA